MTTVLAYLDPGSGSMILQIIAGGASRRGGDRQAVLEPHPRVPAHPQARGRAGPQQTPTRLARAVLSPLLGWSAAGQRGRWIVFMSTPRPHTPPPLAPSSSTARSGTRRAGCSTRAGTSIAPSRRGPEDFKARRRHEVLEQFQDGGGIVPPTGRGHRPTSPRRWSPRAAGVLEHERIPFVSYPYEWPSGCCGTPRCCSSTSARGARARR